MHTLQSLLAHCEKEHSRPMTQEAGRLPSIPQGVSMSYSALGSTKHPESTVCHLGVKDNGNERTHGTQRTRPQEDRAALEYLEPVILVLARPHPSYPQWLGLWAVLLWDPPIYSAFHAI